jgi:hypothetical protein
LLGGGGDHSGASDCLGGRRRPREWTRSGSGNREIAIYGVRPGERIWAIPALPIAPAAAWLFARLVFPLVAAFAAICLSAWLVVVAPAGTVQAATVVAIPCLIVWLRGAKY